MPELIVLLKRVVKSFLLFKLDKWTFQDEQKYDMENLRMPYSNYWHLPSLSTKAKQIKSIG